MLQGLELIARWNPKEVQACGGVQLLQFPESDSFNVHKASHPPSFKQGLRIPATKAQDHNDILTASVTSREPLWCSVLPALLIVIAPFGCGLQAIRENDFRAEALGSRTLTYRSVSTALEALLALLLRYIVQDTTLSFEKDQCATSCATSSACCPIVRSKPPGCRRSKPVKWSPARAPRPTASRGRPRSSRPRFPSGSKSCRPAS